MNSTVQTLLSLDVGTVRTGVAIGNSLARLASPLLTITMADFESEFAKLTKEYQPSIIVVGLPRSLNSQETNQTEFVKQFVADNLSDFKVVFQDEALTSTKAEAELNDRKKPYSKGDIDALAATYILQDYFDNVKLDTYEA